MIPQKTTMVANERPCDSSGTALVAIATGARYLIPEMPCKSRGKARSAADRPRAPATLGERESVNGYLQRLYRQRAQPLRDVHSGGVPACVWHAVGSNSQSPIPSTPG